MPLTGVAEGGVCVCVRLQAGLAETDPEMKIDKWVGSHTRQNGLDGPVIFPLLRLSMHVHIKQAPALRECSGLSSLHQ